MKRWTIITPTLGWLAIGVTYIYLFGLGRGLAALAGVSLAVMFLGVLCWYCIMDIREYRPRWPLRDR